MLVSNQFYDRFVGVQYLCEVFSDIKFNLVIIELDESNVEILCLVKINFGEEDEGNDYVKMVWCVKSQESVKNDYDCDGIC